MNIYTPRYPASLSGTVEATVQGTYLEDPAADPLADGESGTLLIDQIRQLVVTLGTKIAGEEFNLDYLRAIGDAAPYIIESAGTYVIKGIAGVLRKIIYLNVDAGSSTLTVYDNTAAAGTVLVPTHSMTTTQIPGNAPHEVTFDLAFTVGLTVVTTGATDIIVCYR